MTSGGQIWLASTQSCEVAQSWLELLLQTPGVGALGYAFCWNPLHWTVVAAVSKSKPLFGGTYPASGKNVMIRASCSGAQLLAVPNVLQTSRRRSANHKRCAAVSQPTYVTSL